MKDIVFDTGIVTYSVNGKCDVTFNPTDPIFVKRLYSVIEQLEKINPDVIHIHNIHSHNCNLEILFKYFKEFLSILRLFFTIKYTQKGGIRIWLKIVD